MRTRPPARRLLRAGALVPVALLALAAGCGTTSDPVEPAEEGASASSGGQAVVVQDAAGADVVLPDGPATEVVALEWGQAEILTSLGVDVVGLSDVEGYTSWVGESAPLRTEPTDVGLRTEPSVEQIADLQPDLVVGVERSVPDGVLGQLEQIAPVLLVGDADASDPLGAVTEQVQTIATAVGAQEEADALVAGMEERLAENAQTVAEAGLEGTPVVFTSPFADGANVTVRMHGPGSAPQAVMTAMGLEPAWTEEGDAGYGLSSIDVEGLTALPDDTFFLWWANGDSEDPVQSYLGDNAVWTSLPFVQDGRVSAAAEGIWVYGGPASLADFSDDVTQVLTTQAG
ncbi:iron-siderophore ABC transporter substrate-binding protein [Pseudokineococcus sp. 1T1Z-3]|uniref:iron-siderophore ABC transporter substrate-binding protein n=1 Tax=Pseudokineococcus sp. 1T1Z-3 TaxID=3132745 RepID=UPI00309AE417